MTENPEGTLSLDQAVEKMMEVTPEADDKTAEIVEAEEPVEGEPEAEAEEAVGETEETAEEPEYEVETKGGKRKVKLSELLESPMFKADYTQKTMAVAEERKAVEAEKAAISTLKEQLSEALQQWAVPVEQEPNWTELAQKLDPRQYNAARAQWDERKAIAERARNAFQTMQKAQRDKLIAEEQSRLLDAVPEWRDPAAFEAAAREMVDIGRTYGFEPDELAGATDHRVFLVLRDAAAYRKLKSAKPEVTKKVAQTAVTLSPGAKPTRAEASSDARQKQLAQFKKTGSIEDAVALLMR
jgi:hypothetical protein